MATHEEARRKTETSTTVFTIRDDGILHWLLKPGADMTLEAAKENHAAFVEFVDGRDYLCLVDPRRGGTATREAREYYADPVLWKNILAEAMLVNSGLSRIVGGLFLSLNRPKFPMRLFSSETEAVAWLKTFER